MIATVSPYVPVIPPSEGRSPGVHLSGIIKCVAKEVGILERELEEDLSLFDGGDINDVLKNDPIAIIRIAMGLAWEMWYLLTQMPNVVAHPGEWEEDGIYMTPDGEELSHVLVNRGLHVIIHEIKCTYKSIKTIGIYWDEDRRKWDLNLDVFATQWMWKAQIMGYCRKAGTRFAVLHILAVCNDYSWPQRPMCYRINIEFSQDELDSNWQLLVDYRDERMQL